MDLSEMQTRVAELEQQISALPAGSVTKKTVNGKEYFYHRWTENKKRREKYIPADELENFRAQIERRTSTGTISDEKPAFMILFYPVITAEEGKLHKNSFKYLLGKDYSPEEARNYSLEKRVSALTPPTLLLLSDDDRIVPPVNSLLFYEALKRNGVKASIHVFPTGDHGWGIKPEFKYIEQWQRYALDWLEQF